MVLVLVTPLLFCLLLPEVWPRLNYFSLPLLLDKEFCLQLNGQANLVFMASQAKDPSLKLSSYSLTDSSVADLRTGLLSTLACMVDGPRNIIHKIQMKANDATPNLCESSHHKHPSLSWELIRFTTCL